MKQKISKDMELTGRLQYWLQSIGLVLLFQPHCSPSAAPDFQKLEQSVYLTEYVYMNDVGGRAVFDLSFLSVYFGS